MERTVSAGIRWMMNLLSESSPSLRDRDLDERPYFGLEGAIVTVGSKGPLILQLSVPCFTVLARYS